MGAVQVVQSMEKMASVEIVTDDLLLSVATIINVDIVANKKWILTHNYYMLSKLQH